jgi:hypothetical protein
MCLAYFEENIRFARGTIKQTQQTLQGFVSITFLLGQLGSSNEKPSQTLTW